MRGKGIGADEPLWAEAPSVLGEPRVDDAGTLRADVSGNGRGPVRPGAARVEVLVPAPRQQVAPAAPLPGRGQRPPGAGSSDGGIVRPLSRRVSDPGLSFDDRVAPRGYQWWYIDGLSDDGRLGVTVIAFIGSVFSPYYALSGRSRPENHCALNVAIYKPRHMGDPRGNRWSMTERGQRHVARSQHRLQIGPSAMQWQDDTLTIDIDEFTFPIPGRIKGRIRVRPEFLCDRVFALDSANRHQWWPMAPRARIEVDIDSLSVHWRGGGYLDQNFGSEPLEDGFESWHWSRAAVGSEAVILYDIVRRGGAQAALALRVDSSGQIGAFEPPGTVPLGRTPIWRMDRRTQAEGSSSIGATLEDTPFYARSHIRTKRLGVETSAMHESLALGRLRSPISKSLLPWRMPRQFW